MPNARSDPENLPRKGAVIRCAIYTRKSSEEGLEQEFNSLHAQREACEAYISSQKHEGWVTLPRQYDDGGLSGGNLERPALQRLLADIRAREIDTVVVYKVDRLTRALADFAKIVEIFDSQGVAFVSVTQQFNTTTSMGRLTLNVLLSFAQFEREVTGERIRDKIAASKQKGMWMGGNSPLGYDIRNRKLVVNPAEAETVRHIFRRYLALRSVRLLAEELAADGVTSKQRVTGSFRKVGGQKIARGALYRLLQNRLYIGEIVHKGRHYPGQHAAILDRELWGRTQALLADNAGDRRAGRPAKQPSLLTGLIFDGQGQRLSPTHAVKTARRYRYYVSRALITKGRSTAPGGYRIPATEIEQLVCDRLRAFLADGTAVLDGTSPGNSDTARRAELITWAATLAASWPEIPLEQQRHILQTLIVRIEIRKADVALHLIPARLVALFRSTSDNDHPAQVEGGCSTGTIVLSVPASLQRIGRGAQLIVDGAGGRARPNAALIRLLARAHQLQQLLLNHPAEGSIKGLASRAQLNRSYTTRLLRLAWLAPDITHAILWGHQPAGLTAEKLVNTLHIPLDWDAQRVALGFS